MKLSFWDFFRALPVPVYALLMLDDREPRPQDILVWFLLFLALELISIAMGGIGWHAAMWERFANIALVGCLLCRLHYLEIEVARLRKV